MPVAAEADPVLLSKDKHVKPRGHNRAAEHVTGTYSAARKNALPILRMCLIALFIDIRHVVVKFSPGYLNMVHMFYV